MKISLSPTGKLCIESARVSSSEVCPVVNEQPLANWHVEVARDDSSGWGVRYIASELTFGIEVNCGSTTRCWLRCWLEGLSEDIPLDSFGLRFERVENLHATCTIGQCKLSKSHKLRKSRQRSRHTMVRCCS